MSDTLDHRCPIREFHCTEIRAKGAQTKVRGVHGLDKTGFDEILAVVLEAYKTCTQNL